MWDPAFASLTPALFEQLPIGALVWRLEHVDDDDSLRLAGANAAAASMLGLDFAPLLGKRMVEVFPSTAEAVIRVSAKLCREGGSHDFGETPYREHGVGKATFMFRMAGLEGRAVVAFIENLTALKRAEQEARSSALFLEAIVENIPNMVFVKEASELRFARINRAGEQLLGLERAALLGKNDFDFFPPEQAKLFQARDLEALAGSTVVDIAEEPIQTAHGPRWLHTRKVPIRGPDGTPQHLLGISEDITEQRAAAAKMRDLVAQLEASNAELDGFSYSVSHDLRAPLRAINGFSNALLEDHATELSAEGRRVAAVIANNALKMGRLIDDLLQFSRLGRTPLNRQRVDMTQLALAAAEEVREPGRNLEFRIDRLPEGLGDSGLLKQVWLNLLGNAVKYSRKTEHAVIEVSGALTPEGATYTVKDNGVGFDARYASKLFGVFQRLHSSADYEGTGVGLALVQRLLHRHHGWVRAESSVGQGATFVFALPGDDR